MQNYSKPSTLPSISTFFYSALRGGVPCRFAFSLGDNCAGYEKFDTEVRKSDFDISENFANFAKALFMKL